MSPLDGTDWRKWRPGTLARGASWAVVLTIGALILGTAVSISLTRILGAVGYGTYVFALGWVNVAVIVCKFDFDTVAMRFGGPANARGDGPYLRSLARTLVLATLGVTLAFVAVAAAVLALLRSTVPAQTSSVLWAALVLLPPMAVLAVSGAVLQAMGWVIRAQLPTAIIRSVLFLALVLLFGLVARRLTPDSAILANMAGTVAALVLSLAWLHQTIPKGESAVVPAAERSAWFVTARGALAVSIGQVVLSTQTDIVLLGFFSTPQETGFYAVATQLASLPLLGVAAVQPVVSPRIAALYQAGDLVGLQRLVAQVRTGNLLMTTPFIIALVFGGRLILRVFGAGYAEGSYAPLMLLCVVTFLVALIANLGGFLLTLTGHQARAARFVGISAVVYFVVAFALGPRYGMFGVGAATILSTVWRAALIERFARRHLGIRLLGS